LHSLNYALNYTQPCFLFQSYRLPQFSHLFTTANLNSIAGKASSWCQPPEQTKLIGTVSAVDSNKFAVAGPLSINSTAHMLRCLRKGYSELFGQFTLRGCSNDQIEIPASILYPPEIHIRAPHFCNHGVGISIQELVNWRIYFDLRLY
jgi:hypothetical protein